MEELSEVGKTTYKCNTCDVRFIVPQHESAICCPVCRMNRIKPITQ